MVVSVHTFKHEYLNNQRADRNQILSEASLGWGTPLHDLTKELKHHWDGGKAAISFGPDPIRTLVSMATDSSHRVIMGKIL